MFVFVREFFRNLRTTGAIAPSSRRLAAVMTRLDPNRHPPFRILEVGPGTGAFTRRLLDQLRPGDELHIVEINPTFCQVLDKAVLEPFRMRRPDIPVTLHCAPIESVAIDGCFDRVVCGLPFNNFPAPLVRAIFKRMFDLLKPGGELTYFEYYGVRPAKATISGRRGRQNLRRLSALNKSLVRRHEGRRNFVLRNFPPAVALRLKRDD